VHEDKPAATPAKFALADAGINDYSNVWLIGDSLVDLKTAENLGCKGVLFGQALITDKTPIYLSIKNHKELLEVLGDIYA
jgi:phosphoglycolate phosphatase-like HAD superfamily hydrolase